MPSSPPFGRSLTLALAALLVISPLDAQQPATEAAPFAQEIAAFAAWDARNALPASPIVFAGSSSIRLWKTADRFPGLPVVNRGFGGSQLFQVNQYLNETVLRYKPRIVVLYAGDNDINAGRTNDEVFADYQTFVGRVHRADPTIGIIFIPIKPSLSRWALWPRMRALNERVRVDAQARTHVHYLDLATPMLGGDGLPRKELYVADGLHMTEAGYDVWTSLLFPLLRSLQPR